MTLASSRLCTAIALATLLNVGAQAAENAGDDPGALPDLSLEDLLKADVITASRKSQAVQDVAAAVFVISRDDIERSGATNIPEALRIVPGLQVARLASGRWAVSARGFNGRFANKLLVLIDGRSVYSPLFSGVLWEMEGTLLEDIERIEVIRGPGAALWGANAVNGVINVITRQARDTQGGLFALGSGSQERGSAAARWGGAAEAGATHGHWRLWASSDSQRPFDAPDGSPGNDASHTSRAGFRSDWALPSGDSLALSGSVTASGADDRWNQADLLSPSGSTRVDHTQDSDAAHLLARYHRLGGDGSETIVQTYVAADHVQATDAFDQYRSTIDLDLQHRPRLDGPHDVVWGATYRLSRDRIASSGIITITPDRRSFSLASLFVSDEITLVPERLRATLGTRLEHNNFTGFEPQPNARLAWTPNRTQTVWTAVSRAVRTPSRAELDAQVDVLVMPGQGQVPPVLLRAVPPAGHTLQSETVNAFELGYRQQFEANWSVDVAAFYNRYAHLSAASTGAQQFDMLPFPHVVQAVVPISSVAASTRGLEVALDWRATRAWRLQAAYTHFRASVASSSDDPVEVASALGQMNSAPRHQLVLRSSLALASGQDLDARLRYVSALQQGNFGAVPIDAYTELDLRYAMRPRPGLTVSLSADNLLQRQHAEFAPDLLPSQLLEVPRSVHVQAQWKF